MAAAAACCPINQLLEDEAALLGAFTGYIVTLELAGEAVDFLETSFEPVEPIRLSEPAREPSRAELQVIETGSGSLEKTPELIERLARQLALASGEDPDEQPFPMRMPRWRYYCSRAKALLAITPAEYRALEAVVQASSARKLKARADHSVLQ